MTSNEPTKPRKTDAERAEERLGVANRKVEKLERDEKRLEGDLKATRTDLAEARRRRDYLADDPALATTTEGEESEPDSSTSTGGDVEFVVDDDTVRATR